MDKTNLIIKAAGDWELDVLGVPFGSPDDRDSDKQFFSSNTQLHLREGEVTNVYYYHGYTPDGKPQDAPIQIGTAKHERTDSAGHWFRVILDKTSEYARRVWEAAKDGLARASSGSIAHLVRVAKDGQILSWPFAELSVFDTDQRRQPANQNALVTVAKAQFNPVIDQPEATAEANRRGAADTQPLPVGVKTMDENEVKLAIDAALKADREQREAEAKAAAEKQAAIDAAVKAEKEKWEAEAAKSRRLPNHEAPYQAKYEDTWKFDNYDAADLSVTASVLASQGKPVSPALMKSLALKCAEMTGDWQAVYVKSALKAAGIGGTVQEVEATIKAVTDPQYSTLSTYGAQWVGTAYSAAIWAAIRADNRIIAKIPSVVIPDGYSSEYFPLESGDPTWYKVAETTAADSTMKVPAASVPANMMGTAQKQITVAKMGARTMYTGELTEDSLVPFSAQLRQQMQISGAEAMEYVVIDGDTATSSNINDIGGTTYSGAATSLFLLTNGFRKSCLVTTTANSRSAGGSLTEEDFLETAWLMGTAGLNGADIAKTSFVIDPNVYKAALKLANLKTKDVWANATLEKGLLTGLWGYEIVPSWQMHRNSTARLANTAGKVDQDTVGNNTTGAILSVRWDQWKIAFKRRMTMETTRFANSDTWEIVALSRWGLGQRDTEASAITYNVGV